MESHRSPATTTVGFSLLPSELIQYIVLNLCLPCLVRLKSANKSVSSIISDHDFVREYNLKSSSSTWLFIYKKRYWHRKSILHGFSDRCDRWFELSMAKLLDSIVPPGEDLYFLTASGNVFLFALNTSREVISVDLAAKTVKRIPPSPLGPRGTSTWRRSGMKLITKFPNSGNFLFRFAEFHDNRPFLFEYNSETDEWRSTEAEESQGEVGQLDTFLSVVNGRTGSVLVGVGNDGPKVVRPRFDSRGEERLLAVGFSWGTVADQLHVYGDGRMVIVRSESVIHEKTKILSNIELWGLSSNGRAWEFMSVVPNGLIQKIKKPYWAIMGCLEERDGVVRAVFVSNFEGKWDIIWLCYETKRKLWDWVPIHDCKLKGSNMAGISFSSGLTLS